MAIHFAHAHRPGLGTFSNRRLSQGPGMPIDNEDEPEGKEYNAITTKPI